MDNIDGETYTPEGDFGARGGVVTARGTSEGLVIRLDGKVDHETLKTALRDFITSREKFLRGNEVLLEWMGTKADDTQEAALAEMLLADYNITVKASVLRAQVAVKKEPILEALGLDELPALEPSKRSLQSYEEDGVNLFSGMDGLSSVNQKGKKGPFDSGAWDEPDTRIVFATLRSGQRIETEHSIVVFGDVNSGAEVVAGGDIIVLGALRGVAHAGAYDETGGGRSIFALSLQATQLRIGSIISRGGAEARQKGAEVARVDRGFIVVELYSAKAFLSKR